MQSPKWTLFVVKLMAIAVAGFGLIALVTRGVEAVRDTSDRMH
jgi:hypothetical protein